MKKGGGSEPLPFFPSYTRLHADDKTISFKLTWVIFYRHPA